MKIALLCGALEPGKDGVGDYSRKLAGFCRANNHAVFLVSLNDPWIDIDTSDAKTSELRLSRDRSWPERMEVLETALADFEPDIISLQFVPYAFHRRGFCSELTKSLKSIGQENPWHIMFHELWLGLNPADSLKYKAVGWWQRKCTLRLARSLAPIIVHTHTAAYGKFLKAEYITAKRLPLFSNIEISHNPDFSFLHATFAEHLIGLSASSRSEFTVAVFFGSLHPEWHPEVMMQKFLGKKILFLSMGRLGNVGRLIWQRFSQHYARQAHFLDLGELAENEISAVLQFSDVGIAASPWNLIGKSGTVAAMLEHGLPVVVTRNDFLPDEKLDIAWRDELHPVWEADFSIDRLQKKPPASRLPEIGFQFLDDLQQSVRRA